MRVPARPASPLAQALERIVMRITAYTPAHIRRQLAGLCQRSGRQLGSIAASADMTLAALSNILHGRRENPGIGTVGRILHALARSGLTWTRAEYVPRIAPFETPTPRTVMVLGRGRNRETDCIYSGRRPGCLVPRALGLTLLSATGPARLALALEYWPPDTQRSPTAGLGGRTRWLVTGKTSGGSAGWRMGHTSRAGPARELAASRPGPCAGSRTSAADAGGSARSRSRDPCGAP